MPEEYARKINPNGTVRKYRTKAEYQQGRLQASASAASQRSGINRAIGGNVV